MTLLGKIVPEQEGRQDSILANQQAFCLLGKHSDCDPGSCQLFDNAVGSVGSFIDAYKEFDFAVADDVQDLDIHKKNLEEYIRNIIMV